jgi:hypothetical protein
MLRTMGSSLMAKASPGGAFRKTEEARIDNPALPGKGEIGTISRGMMEEPIERQVPPGSTKVVSSSPAVEPTTEATPIGMLPTQPLAPTQPSTPGMTPTRGTGNPPDVGIIQPALRSQSTGVAGKTTSGGALQGAQAATLYQPPQGPQTDVLGAQAENRLPLAGGPGSASLAGKVIATGGQGSTQSYSNPNPIVSGARSIAGALGEAGRTVGNALGIPQVGFTSALRSFASNPQNTNALNSAANKVAQSVSSNIRSGGAIGQAAQKVSGWLRSLFGK